MKYEGWIVVGAALVIVAAFLFWTGALSRKNTAVPEDRTQVKDTALYSPEGLPVVAQQVTTVEHRTLDINLGYFDTVRVTWQGQILLFEPDDVFKALKGLPHSGESTTMFSSHYTSPPVPPKE